MVVRNWQSVLKTQKLMGVLLYSVGFQSVITEADAQVLEGDKDSDKRILSNVLIMSLKWCPAFEM